MESIESKMPTTIKPMLASEASHAFDSTDYIFEFKWDGYRTIAVVDEGEVNLYSRNLLSFNKAFSPIADSLKPFPFNAIFDGEIVVLDEKGHPSIKLIEKYGSTRKGIIQYQVFDILYLNNESLLDLPLIERKRILKDVLLTNDKIVYCDHIEEQGTAFFNLVKEQDYEGIVAKKKDSKYKPGSRSEYWLKIPIKRKTDAVIIGYTIPRTVKLFGSLVLGIYNHGKLEYLGHSGGLFKERDKQEIFNKLQPLVRDTPVAEIPKDAFDRGNIWVEPQYVCEVQYREVTSSGKLRLPVFQRMRYDKDPLEATRGAQEEQKEKVAVASADESKQREEVLQIPEGVDEYTLTLDEHHLHLTHLCKVFFPEDNLTKRDLFNYYIKIAPYILSYLEDRPNVINRHIDGIHEENTFHQSLEGLARNYKAKLPDWIETTPVYTETYKREVPYYVVNNLLQLLFLVQLGCIEINPWHSRRQHLKCPDYIVLDLDPTGIDFSAVVETAQAAKEVIDEVGLQGFPKTSGKTGLHIYIPVNASYSTDETYNVANLICKLLHEKMKGILSLERNPDKREGKVYCDWHQNAWSRPLAAPYCIRPVAGAPISTPIKWEELRADLNPSRWTIRTIFDRIATEGDLFEGLKKLLK
jgi:bifunctional non-homologous end joining protein LigD